MFRFFKKIIKKEEKSGEFAKNRLKVVIMQDRTSITPIMMQNLQKDLIKVFSKYIEMEENELSVVFNTENRGLSISIPIKKVITQNSTKNVDSDEK